MESLASLSSSSFLNHHALAKPTHRALALKLHSPLCIIHGEDDQNRGGGTMPCPEERLEWSPQKALLSSPSSSASSDTVSLSDRRRWIPSAQGESQSKVALIQEQKGSAFTLKLEEMLIALKNKERQKIGLRNNVINPRRKFSDVDTKGEKTDLVESKPLLLNLFANSPNVPWDADKKYFYSTNLKPQLPIGRKRILGRKSNRSNFDASKRGNGSLMNPDAYKGKRSPMNVKTMPKNKVDDEKYELQERLAQRERRVPGSNKDLSNFDAYKGKKEVLNSANMDSTLENKKMNNENYGLQEFKDNMGKWKIDTQIENHAEIEEGITNFNWTDSDDEENGSLTPWSTSGDEENAPATYSCIIDDDLVPRQERRRSFDIHINEKDTEVPHETDMPTSSSDKKPTWQQHNIPDLPFEFRYSYTEIPKAPILGYRERPYSPFGPISIRRPWTGGKPPNPTKKKVPEFDSFNPPPKNKKGVKFVQDPGPFNEGQGPKPAKTREEILGDPLSKEDIVYLVEKCQRENRQLNLGRDGLTHNMLDTIHCHWKRRRVCKIKCKGVPTVDMDNVCYQIEDKTGGKIIYRTGGVLYLFRGRNYNYKDRPKIPLMLWKPASPIYPNLIQDAPEELTKEEAYKLRVLGRKVEPICKIGKNGFYSTLVEDVRNAFKLDDLVRIDCQGLKPTDYKKIGAKLKDLVPCVLLSFRKEHILMWKGRGKVRTTNNESASQDMDDSMPERSTSQSKEKSVLCTDDLVLAESCISSELSLCKVDAQGDGKGIERAGKIQDEDTKVYIESLWDHAIECGMAIELDTVDMDLESIVNKATKLAETSPTGPIYTHTLLKKLRVKTEWKEQGDEQVQVYFGRTRYVDRPNKRAVKKRSYQLPTLDVPPMGGLPVDELAKLLAV